MHTQEVLTAIANRAEQLVPTAPAEELVPVMRLLGAAEQPHLQLAVAVAGSLRRRMADGGADNSVAAAAELAYMAARQGVEDREAAAAVLRVAEQRRPTPVDAARLLVAAQVWPSVV